MTILWWHWLVLGLLLVAAEMATAGGFYVIFFGLAAVVVGLAAAAGLAGPEWVQVLAFSALSIAGLAFFRTRLLRWLQMDPQAPAIDSLIGEIGTATDILTPGDIGKIELRGASWSARNSSQTTLISGARCRVLGVDGLTLHVGPEGPVS